MYRDVAQNTRLSPLFGEGLGTRLRVTILNLVHKSDAIMLNCHVVCPASEGTKVATGSIVASPNFTDYTVIACSSGHITSTIDITGLLIQLVTLAMFPASVQSAYHSLLAVGSCNNYL